VQSPGSASRPTSISSHRARGASQASPSASGSPFAKPKGGTVSEPEEAASPRATSRLKPLIRKTPPFSKRIAHKGVWVEPKLLAEIEYRAKSAEGKVRHPFFKGLREDL
jgi:hypothetical protein